MVWGTVHRRLGPAPRPRPTGDLGRRGVGLWGGSLTTTAPRTRRRWAAAGTQRWKPAPSLHTGPASCCSGGSRPRSEHTEQGPAAPTRLLGFLRPRPRFTTEGLPEAGRAEDGQAAGGAAGSWVRTVRLSHQRDPRPPHGGVLSHPHNLRPDSRLALSQPQGPCLQGEPARPLALPQHPTEAPR